MLSGIVSNSHPVPAWKLSRRENTERQGDLNEGNKHPSYGNRWDLRRPETPALSCLCKGNLGQTSYQST